MRGRLCCIIFLIAAGPLLRDARGAIAQEWVDEQINGKLSWIHWWETNRETYLKEVLRGRETAPPATQGTIDARSKVVEALLKATSHQERDVRAEALLALARMGDAGGLERMHALAKDDPEARVRCRAIVAMGLMQDRQGLRQVEIHEESEDVALMAALGLLDQPDDADLAAIRKRVDPKSEEVCRMALWALRQHRKAKDRETALKVLRESPSYVLACEAMMTLAATGDGADDIASLEEIAAEGANAQRLPCFAANARAVRPIMHLRAAACLALAQFEGPKDAARPNQPPAIAANGGVDQAQIRAGNILSQAVFRFATDARGPQQLFPAMAALALPKYGQTSIAEDLVNLRWPTFRERGGSPEVQLLRLEPQRGMAAMALGISGGIRPPQGLGQDARDAVRSLTTYLTLTAETRFNRAGFAVGLGLTGDRQHATALANAARQINPRDNLLLGGHLVLALGMLQDERALQASAALLSSEKNPARITSAKLVRDLKSSDRADFKLTISRMDYTLGKRAALLGLAALGDSRAAPMLRAELAGGDPFVSIEAARAMNWCAVPESDALCDALATSTNPEPAAMAALLLGEMYDKDRPSKLSRLVAGNYYGLTIFAAPAWYGPPDAGIQREFHGLGNRFLYFHLLRLRPDLD